MQGHEARRIGEAVLDLIVDYLDGLEKRPLFDGSTPASVEERITGGAPRSGSDPLAILEEFRRDVLPHCIHVGHPSYFGLMTPSPTVVGVFADALASAINQNVGAWRISPSATAIERLCLRWITDLVGYGPQAGGNLTSGGMMANLTAAKLARDARGGEGVTARGIQDASTQGRLTAYVSEERHVSIDKSFDIVGIGRENLRSIPTDDRFRIDVAALEAALARDRAAGCRPVCLIGIAGTTNTGAVDPLPALADIAEREGMWFHVDAAYGGAALLSPRLRPLLTGIERADSVTIDPHKWFFLPLDAGAIVARDAARLRESFGMRPSYLVDAPDPGGERFDFYVHGMEQSRRFRSLKLWMSWKALGTEGIARAVEANVAAAKHLGERVDAEPSLERVHPVDLSICCFRFEPREWKAAVAARDPATLKRLVDLHNAAQRAIERGGRAWISTTILKGLPAYRVNVMNYRTTPRHMDEVLGLVLEESVRAFEN